MHVIYVIGAPGAGKSTMVNAALDALDRTPDAHTQPVPHIRYGDIWYLGKRRPDFSGTDALAMNIQPRVIEWLHELNQHGATRPRILIGEGDRLGNGKFFDAVHACGYKLSIIHLDLPPNTCRERSLTRGTTQAVTWWKGRQAKVDNLVNSRRTITLDATCPPGALAVHLTGLFHDRP